MVSHECLEDQFVTRHIGPDLESQAAMLKELGYDSLDKFIESVVPSQIRTQRQLQLKAFPTALSEEAALDRLRTYADKNQLCRSYLGLGYYDCFTPTVIQRNILENPGWYTQYTPYQPEISQGRLEALLNYQTMVTDLTGLDIANASLLDEGTAAAEAMAMSFNIRNKEAIEANVFFVSDECFPQTIDVVKTRARALGINVVVGAAATAQFTADVFGVLLQYPGKNGEVADLSPVIEKAHQSQALVTVAADILALVLLTPPGKLGADIAVGSTQRFGVPLGFGGPHAAYFATKDEYKRSMSGRLIGVSRDAEGNPALRLALQTREQHIRREKATSNICTAQVLLAVIASMYAVYHGPAGLKRIARRVNLMSRILRRELEARGVVVKSKSFFDTIVVEVAESEGVLRRAQEKKINLRLLGATSIAVALDETVKARDLADIISAITGNVVSEGEIGDLRSATESLAEKSLRKDNILAYPVFQKYHTETEFLRYVRRLEARDLSLGTSMIPLGSCTMKLNATSEMLPLSWAEFSKLHPFAPQDQSGGYAQLFSDLESALCDVTGFDAVSLQPNAGSQGEFAGLLAIAEYHKAQGQGDTRTICLIPLSAHGTNPASAVMAGMQVVVVACDENGNVALNDLKAKVEQYGEKIAALMVTYPSTHGVFEEDIKKIAEVVHSVGGQVYMDGANLNALVGLVKPAEIGADVCHINLHKTFCIPHGGGGPGMGPIGVRKHLAPYLPGHPLVELSHQRREGSVSAAPWGSASILTISWMYCAMMGGEGLTHATKVAILNANYMAFKLKPHFPVLYLGKNGLVAHECIFDLRPLKKESGVEVEDVAKRLMDYGFHAPTVSFPVAGTLMVEPTESESKEELDRFIEAMVRIRAEIQEIADGTADAKINPLKLAPHTARAVTAAEWVRPYSRERAAFPAVWLTESKFWPSVARIDGSYGDRNLVCSCVPIADFRE